MVSKICQIIEELQQAEEFFDFIEKWQMFLDVKEKKVHLKELMVSVNRIILKKVFLNLRMD
jgi:hypothetical protein